MPWRNFLAEEMADLLRVLSHPHRIRIIHELRNGPMDVNGLQSILNISHARVSQYLSALKQHHLVSERRDGRHVFYSLRNPDLSRWLVDGMQYLITAAQHQAEVQQALRQSSAVWGQDGHNSHKPNGTTTPKAIPQTNTDPGDDLQ